MSYKDGLVHVTMTAVTPRMQLHASARLACRPRLEALHGRSGLLKGCRLAGSDLRVLYLVLRVHTEAQCLRFRPFKNIPASIQNVCEQNRPTRSGWIQRVWI